MSIPFTSAIAVLPVSFVPLTDLASITSLLLLLAVFTLVNRLIGGWIGFNPEHLARE